MESRSDARTGACDECTHLSPHILAIGLNIAQSGQPTRHDVRCVLLRSRNGGTGDRQHDSEQRHKLLEPFELGTPQRWTSLGCGR